MIQLEQQAGDQQQEQDLEAPVCPEQESDILVAEVQEVYAAGSVGLPRASTVGWVAVEVEDMEDN